MISLDISCDRLLDSSYRSTLAASYIVASISVVILFVYSVICCSSLCCPGQSPARDEDRGIVIASASIIEPSVVVHATASDDYPSSMNKRTTVVRVEMVDMPTRLFSGDQGEPVSAVPVNTHEY